MSEKQGVESSGGDGREIVFSGSSPFDQLPEDCISNIISFTSPRDACVAASVSKTFESAVNSDNLWEMFLPPNHSSLFPESRVFSSKKELYFALSNPVLIEDGKKSLWLEKASGKRYLMLSAKQLAIKWGTSPQHWQWISVPESRFEKVAVLINTKDFKIHGWMNTGILSPGTHYSAYVVYKLSNQRRGLRDLAVQVAIGLRKQESPERFICFDESKDEHKEREIVKSEKREDGWIEAEIGDFFNQGGLMDLNEIELSIVNITSYNWMSGLIIQGIEFRPKDCR